MKRLKILSMIIFFLISTGLPWAGTSGKDAGGIKGKVIDSDSKEPVIGARIEIDNPDTGAITNPFSGGYIVEDIPVGLHTVKARCIGYNPITISGVEIYPGVTTEIVVSLESQTIDIAIVNIVDTIPQVKPFDWKDIDIEQIEKLPHDKIREIASRQSKYYRENKPGPCGRIAGTIKDGNTGLPVLETFAVIKENKRIAIIDSVYSDYVFHNVYPGIYTIEVSCPKYNNTIISKIKVMGDVTTMQDIKLYSKEVRGTDTTFIAENDIGRKYEPPKNYKMNKE